MSGFISYINHVDNATVTGSATLGSLVPSTVQSTIIGEVTRLDGTTGQLMVDFGADQPVQALGLAMPPDGVVMDASDSIRWRLSSSAMGAGEVYDSGAVASGMSERYGIAGVLLPAEVTARYLQVDFNAPSLATQNHLDIGRLWAGPAFVPVMGMEAPLAWRSASGDSPEVRQGARSLIQFADQGVSARELEPVWPVLSEAEGDAALAFAEAVTTREQFFLSTRNTGIATRGLFVRCSDPPTVEDHGTHWSLSLGAIESK
ncbi:MAG: hypothetical protein ACPGOY_04735 [Rhodospirillaceae bacterium]